MSPADIEVPSLDQIKDEVGIDGGVHAAVQPSTQSIDRSLVKGIAWVGSVKWIVQAVTWGATIVIARILTPSDYGLLSMGTVILTFISLLSESGLGTTVVQKREISDEQTAQLNGAAILLGSASFVVACLLAIPVGWFYNEPRLPPVIAAASFSLVITAFRVVPGALLGREMRFPRLALIDATAGILQAAGTLVFAILGFRYWSLVLGATLGSLLGTALTVASRPHRFSMPNWETLKPLLPFTRQILIGRLCWYAYQDSDFVVAGKRLGSRALGGYSYAWTLASVPVDKITALVGGVTAPVFAAVQYDDVALRRYFLSITEGLAVVAFPLTIGLALVAGELVPTLLGAEWTFMVTPLRLLAAYASIRTIAPIASHLLTAIGESRYQMYVSALAAVVFPTSFYIGSHWGTLGIAVAWMVAHPLVVYLPLNTRVARRLKLSVGSYLKALWPAVSGCLLMSGGVILAHIGLPSAVRPALRLGAEILAGAILYSGCLLLFHRKRIASFRALIQSARA